MYKSPIDIICGQMETQMEGEILRAVQKYGINVDKEELLRALRYDREQYDKGYADGKVDAMAELVRCRDCKHLECGCKCYRVLGAILSDKSYLSVNDDDFCSYGERRSDG